MHLLICLGRLLPWPGGGEHRYKVLGHTLSTAMPKKTPLSGLERESMQAERFLLLSPQCRMLCKDIPAETMYDVLHDIEYRRKWDANVIETFDIGKLTVNADVGYYSWKCPKPLKNRDVITLRSWLPMGNDYIIMNYSVKHAKYPPKKDLVRAVSIQTGYLIQHTGPISCTLTYLAQVDPRGSLPKWVVNKSSQFLAPKVSKVCTGSLHPYTRLFLHSFTLLSGGYLFCSSLSTFDAGNPALVIKVSGQFK
uniref:START domain-containing protein 10 n=1 Tax=Sinocyclocheilus anshuiensis TaxID=1608454 RepID=A0A671MKJ4_9TELE